MGLVCAFHAGGGFGITPVLCDGRGVCGDSMRLGGCATCVGGTGLLGQRGGMDGFPVARTGSCGNDLSGWAVCTCATGLVGQVGGVGTSPVWRAGSRGCGTGLSGCRVDGTG